MAKVAAGKPYGVKHVGRNVCVLDIEAERRKGWEQFFLLTSDRHWDNPKSDRRKQKEHLEEARERNAGVIDAGDLFCAMQGKYDKRANKNDLRPEHQEGKYFDALVNTATDWFAPYAGLFDVIGKGNHETSILARQETDLIERLVGALNHKAGSNIQAGGYGGWVKFQFRSGPKRTSVNLKYFHGSGGGGAVTKGVINTNRMAVYLPDADIVLTGHVHEQWLVELCRERLTQGGNIRRDTQTHICAATYKEEYGDGSGGYHIEKGRPPKPIGAWWLRFFWDCKTERVNHELSQAK